MTAVDFLAWRHETLAEFATEAAETLRAQELELQHLKADLRTALDAYRALLREGTTGCAECGKQSTPNSMWALYCTECIQKHGIGDALKDGTGEKK